MRSFIVAAATLALAAAVPVSEPSGIDFDVFNEALPALLPDVEVPVGDVTETKPFDPTPVQSSAIAGATSGDLEKRGTCAVNALGGGPTVSNPDTDVAFLAYKPFHVAAKYASTPKGYTLVTGFQDLNASASTSSYLGVNSTLTTYSPSQCAAQCNAIEGCVSFNIYFERDPTLDADDTSCPNPPSLTRIKCAFWGLALQSTDATNAGQYQSQFHVVIAGSNAYTNTPAAIDGYGGPTNLGSGIIQPPNGDTTYMGQQTFPNAAYDPSLCAEACEAKSAYNVKQYNSRHSSSSRYSSSRYNWKRSPHSSSSNDDDDDEPRICKFFNAFILYKNGRDAMFTCMYYTASFGERYATNKGQWDDNGNHWTITQSYSYSASS